MARLKKEKEQVIEFDIHLEDDVYIHVELNTELDEWIKDIYQQLDYWRNIPSDDSINMYDISVVELCNANNVDPRSSKGSKAREVIERSLRSVKKHAKQARKNLTETLYAVKYLRDAIIFDELLNRFRFRPDVAALFAKDEIDEAIDEYFETYRVKKHRPQFPTVLRSVPAEYIFPLVDILVSNFDILAQIARNVRELNIQDTGIDAREDESSVDDKGFQPERLDSILDKSVSLPSDSHDS